jgi:alkaline phosphatase isozyme conversion protein
MEAEFPMMRPVMTHKDRPTLPGMDCRSRRVPVAHRILAGVLLLAMLPLLLPLTGCGDAAPSKTTVANYGTYGSNVARKLAVTYPLRSAGSTQERSAGDMIIKALKDMGYEPIVTEFGFTDGQGETLQSRNIAVKIAGKGFTLTDADGKTSDIRRQVIIGAHYDTPVSVADVAAAKETAATGQPGTGETTAEVAFEPSWADYDGIHDNASGIGALLTAAKEMKSVHYGYDVILVAFGAGSAGQAGALYYASQLSKAEVAATDAMYCIDSIYAGDKVYAHSGWNSLEGNYQKDYGKRRKLYEVTDVFYEYELYTNNNFMLYTNMASFDVTVEGIPTPVVYREWSLTESDYRPFDQLDIPIVFFESGNYDAASLEEVQESKNPSFGATSGKIRGTQFDQTDYLAQILNTTRATAGTGEASQAAPIDQLTKRINNVAFILLEAIRRGPAGTTMR